MVAKMLIRGDRGQTPSLPQKPASDLVLWLVITKALHGFFIDFLKHCMDQYDCLYFFDPGLVILFQDNQRTVVMLK